MKKTAFIQMIIIISILAIMCAFVIACEVGANQIPVMVLVINAFKVLSTGLCCFIVLLLGWWAYQWWEKHPTYGNAETSFNLFLNNRRKARALKNAAQIILPLQVFFYGVLARNKDVLGVNPGADVRNLSQGCRNVESRNNSILYVYGLILSIAPDLALDVLKRLINQFILAELANYGIADLPSYFTASNGRTYPSVYLDRLTYDEYRHVLSFEILFIGSNSAANALERAWERDNPKTAKPETEVYDDEL